PRAGRRRRRWVEPRHGGGPPEGQGDRRRSLSATCFPKLRGQHPRLRVRLRSRGVKLLGGEEDDGSEGRDAAVRLHAGVPAGGTSGAVGYHRGGRGGAGRWNRRTPMTHSRERKRRRNYHKSR
uniref:Uncharacterized protein n=1 Tax=Aegilops tauschii subsp. strangulata TaxID=200361 RepID=A0A453MZ80_AEGTS